MPGEACCVPDAAGGSFSEWDEMGRWDVAARSTGEGETRDACSDSAGEGDGGTRFLGSERSA